MKTDLKGCPFEYPACYLERREYVKKSPDGLAKVLRFLDTPGLNSSDVVKFIMDQPDFHEYGASMKEMVV
jgi:hypothetical protein